MPIINFFSTMFTHPLALPLLSASATSLQSSHRVLVRVHGEISLQGLLAADSVCAWNGNRILPDYPADNQARLLEGLNAHSVHGQSESLLIYSSVWPVWF